MSLSPDQALRSAKSLSVKQQFAEARDTLVPVLQRFPANARLRTQLAEVVSAELRGAAVPFGPPHLALLLQVKSHRGPHVAYPLALALALLNPANPNALATAGGFALDCGNLDAARQHLQAALALDAGFAAASVNLARVADLQGHADESQSILRACLERKPEFLPALTALGRLLLKQRRFVDAYAVWKTALAQDGKSFATVSHFAEAAAAAGDAATAIAELETYVAANPKDYGAHINLGNLLLSENRAPAAQLEFEAAIALDVSKGAAHYNLARARRFKAGDPAIARMEQVLSDPDLPAIDAMQTEFALAKALDDLKDYDAAFAHFARANALRRSQINYSIAQETASMASIRRAFSGKSVIVPTGSPRPARVPIFVTGMMRSGTTLMEQILTSHPMVDGAGELDDLTDLLEPLVQSATPPTTDALLRARVAYLDRIAAVPGDGPFVVDKMPSNFRWIGAIRQILPEAPILHMQRDAMAVCWSIWRTYFTSPRIGFAYDMAELADYHDLYAAMMDHWHQSLPDAVMDVDYAALTRNPDPVIRAVLDYSGLPFDPACLSPEKNTSAVRTASLTQVRQPIYAGSNEQWHAYRAHLGPLMDRFGAK